MSDLINDSLANFFRRFGYRVTCDQKESDRWYEIYEGSEQICQIDWVVPLQDLLEDLPFLALGQSGTSKTDYQVRYGSLPSFVKMCEKVLTSQPPGATDITNAWTRGFAACLSEMYLRSPVDGSRFVAASRGTRLTLATFRQAGVSPFDLFTLSRAGVR